MHVSSAEPSLTVGVTVLESNNGSASTEDVSASIKRTADGGAATKHGRQSTESHSTSIQPQGERLTPTIPQMISKKKKPKPKLFKQGLGGHAAMYDAVT